MHRKYELDTKARLSFSGGPHAPVNMADSMENAGSWTISGSKEAMEVPKNFKDLRKLGVRNMRNLCTFLKLNTDRKVTTCQARGTITSGAWHNHFRRVTVTSGAWHSHFWSWPLECDS